MAEDWPVVGLLAAVGVLLLVTAGVALTGAFGLAGSDATSVAPATPSTPTDAPTEPRTTAGPPFTLETRGVEECGVLCRNVTSTVTNEQSRAAHEVTIETRLYAGNDTDGQVRWERFEPVGRIDAGGSYRATRRVELPLEDALAIREADGWVTIRTTVDSAGQSVTVTDRQDVI
jgi:hypothetical protein